MKYKILSIKPPPKEYRKQLDEQNYKYISNLRILSLKNFFYCIFYTQKSKKYGKSEYNKIYYVFFSTNFVFKYLII